MSAIDEAGMRKVQALIEKVKGAGLTEAGEMFSTVYWGWLRTMEAYRYGLPYVVDADAAKAEGIRSPASALHITNVIIAHWAPLIPGTPKIDNDAVLEEARDDAAWHQNEDYRMHREAGDDI